MSEREEGKRFVERVLGRRWDNFGERVAATYYHEVFLRGHPGSEAEKMKEKLLRLIYPESLEKVIEAYGKK